MARHTAALFFFWGGVIIYKYYFSTSFIYCFVFDRLARHTAALFFFGGYSYNIFFFHFIYILLSMPQAAPCARAGHIVRKCGRVHNHLYIDFHVYSANRMFISFFFFLYVGSYVASVRQKRALVACFYTSSLRAHTLKAAPIHLSSRVFYTSSLRAHTSGKHKIVSRGSFEPRIFILVQKSQ